MRKIVIWGVLTLFFSFFLLNSVPAEDNEKGESNDKAAVVNGVVITKNQFEREMDQVKQRFQMRNQPIDDSQIAELQEKVLGDMIDNELLYQSAQQMGFEVKPEEVQEKYASLKARFPDESLFEKTLGMMGITVEEVKEQIKRGLAIKQFIDKKFVEKMNIPDQEVKEYYDSHPEYFKEKEQIKASHILIKVDEDADEKAKKEAMDKIKAVQEKIKKGEDFTELAKTDSEGPSAPKGGDLGFFGRGQMVKPFEDAAFALKTGEVSDVVETQFGYHLIKVFEHKPESTQSFDSVKDKIVEFLKQQKVQTEVNEYLTELKKTAKIDTYIN